MLKETIEVPNRDEVFQATVSDCTERIVALESEETPCGTDASLPEQSVPQPCQDHEHGHAESSEPLYGEGDAPDIAI
jgi:hypothetical protein